MLFPFPHLLDLLAPPLRAGASLSNQESCTSRLFLGHMKHTSPQQRELGTTIHAPFNELEPIHMPFERTLAAIGSVSPASTAALSCWIPLANDFNSGKWLSSTELSQLSNCCP